MSDKPVTTMELTTKTKQNLELVLRARTSEILAVAAQNVREDKAYLTRAKLTLLASPCEPLLKTEKGIRTALECITNAAMAGLSFGGLRPQCYPVPKDGGVVLVVEASGMKHVCTYGIGANLAEYPRLITVHEGDGVRVDPDKNEIIYPPGGIDPFSPERGKKSGFLMRLKFKDGRPDEIKQCSMSKVKEIQKGYSMTNSPMFTKSPEEADEKTAEKSMLRKVFKEAIGVAQMIIEGDDHPVQEEPAVVRDQSDRLSQRMAKATEGMKSAEPVQTVEDAPEAEEEATPEPEKVTERDPDVLFD